MQHRNSHTYISRRFGFLYHRTLSSSTRRVTMGSADSAVLTILSKVSVIEGDALRCKHGRRVNHALIVSPHAAFPGIFPRLDCKILSRRAARLNRSRSSSLVTG
jgi:hypothetical protein